MRFCFKPTEPWWHWWVSVEIKIVHDCLMCVFNSVVWTDFSAWWLLSFFGGCKILEYPVSQVQNGRCSGKTTSLLSMLPRLDSGFDVITLWTFMFDGVKLPWQKKTVELYGIVLLRRLWVQLRRKKPTILVQGVESPQPQVLHGYVEKWLETSVFFLIGSQLFLTPKI